MLFKVEDCILHEDRHILVCDKPAGIAVQSAGYGQMDLECALKNHLSSREGKAPYLAVIHRLDQPVEGLVVFAKTPWAAGNLNRQLTSGKLKKRYLAVTEVKPKVSQGTLVDCLLRDGRTNLSRVVPEGTPGSKRAELSFTFLGQIEGTSRYLLSVEISTGRHHQIRVQLSHAGMPLVGDRKYNPQDSGSFPLGLCAVELKFTHPATGKPMTFTVKPKGKAFLPLV